MRSPEPRGGQPVPGWGPLAPDAATGQTNILGWPGAKTCPAGPGAVMSGVSEQGGTRVSEEGRTTVGGRAKTRTRRLENSNIIKVLMLIKRHSRTPNPV